MAQPEPRLTPAEYLTLERAAETKSEYFDGRIFAMAGASRRHLWHYLVSQFRVSARD